MRAGSTAAPISLDRQQPARVGNRRTDPKDALERKNNAQQQRVEAERQTEAHSS